MLEKSTKRHGEMIMRIFHPDSYQRKKKSNALRIHNHRPGLLSLIFRFPLQSSWLKIKTQNTLWANNTLCMRVGKHQSISFKGHSLTLGSPLRSHSGQAHSPTLRESRRNNSGWARAKKILETTTTPCTTHTHVWIITDTKDI